MFGGSGALSVSAGITFVYSLGATLPNWRWVCGVCGAIPCLVFVLMPFLPETPNWLIMKGKRAEAHEVCFSTSKEAVCSSIISIGHYVAAWRETRHRRRDKSFRKLAEKNRQRRWWCTSKELDSSRAQETLSIQAIHASNCHLRPYAIHRNLCCYFLRSQCLSSKITRTWLDLFPF